MTAPGETPHDHGLLTQAALAVVEDLSGVESALEAAPGAAGWMPDWENARRAAQLADHLRAALALSQLDQYASAFALLRTGLEQHFTDELLLRAHRYEQTYLDIDDTRFAEWKVDLAARSEPWTEGVHGFRREGKDVVAIRDGMSVTNEAGEVTRHLSPYYAWMRHHDALIGKPADQDMLGDGVIDRVRLRAHADRNEALYRRYLTWSSIRRNLELNGLWSALDLRRVDVHYRFLSAFTHATHGGYEMLGRGQANAHVCSELILLYVATIAAREALVFLDYLAEGGSTIWIGEPELRERAKTAEVVAGHLWFPGTAPHAFDKWKRRTGVGSCGSAVSTRSCRRCPRIRLRITSSVTTPIH